MYSLCVTDGLFYTVLLKKIEKEKEKKTQPHLHMLQKVSVVTIWHLNSPKILLAQNRSKVIEFCPTKILYLLLTLFLCDMNNFT